MDTWLYLGESIEKKLDQLELEGERINLMEFSEEKQSSEESWRFFYALKLLIAS